MKARLVEFTGFLVGPLVLYLVPFFLDKLSTGRVFLAWPGGSLWSNMIASLWWVLIVAWTTWYFRDHIGKRLAGWLAKHHPQKNAFQHLEARLNEATAHALAARHIANDTYKALNGGEDHPLAPGNGSAPHPTMVVTGPETNGSGQANPAATQTG